MATAGSSISPSENSYREKPKIVASFSEFGRAGYVTKREKSKKKMTGKKLKSIMVGYADNHTRDKYNLCNTETKRVIMSRDVLWAD